LPTFDLYDITPTQITQTLDGPAPDFLLIDETSIESQWFGQAPSTNFHFLSDGPGLRELGIAQGYTLYRVGPSRP